MPKSFQQFLLSNDIEYEYQKRFKWLGRQSLDFYLPKYNIGIECQGIQHFKAAEYFGGDIALEQNKIRDKRKFDLCKENGIRLLYYSNLGIEYPYEVFEDKEELLIEILKK